MNFARAFIALAIIAITPPALGQYVNRTIMYFGPGHGTQVEYYAPNGVSWLWYPGNRTSLPGRYKVEGSNICFQYGPNTYNPVTGSRGGTWECGPIAFHDNSIVETLQGDVFDLADGTIPFILEPDRVTIETLSRRAPGRRAPAGRSGLPAAPQTSLSN